MRLVASLLVSLLLLSSANAQTFTLQDSSEARFYIDEVLLGNDKTVVGVTNDVTGTVTFDASNPQAAEVSTITIDATTLSTDDNRRNNQIQQRILETSDEANATISFTPTSISGLPESVAVGDSFEVILEGDLNLHGITNTVSFPTTVTYSSEGELTGIGQTTILLEDYAITIPSVPIVANTGDTVILELEFVAALSE